MEKSHFPGYHRCTACESLIPKQEIHDHILTCRSKSSIQKNLCIVCNKQIDIKQFEEHILTCNEQQSVSSNQQSPTSDQFVENFDSHSLICDNDSTGYQTPRAESPIQIEKNSPKEIIKQTKRCILCSQQIDQSDYGNHVASCSNDDQHVDQYQNKNNNKIPSQNKSCSQIDENSSKSSIRNEKKQTKVCALCSQSFDQSEYEDHVQSCSNDDKYFSRSLPNNPDPNDDTKNFSSKRNSSPYSSQKNLNSSKNSSIISPNNKTKVCVLCSRSFDQSEYEDHVQSCSNDQQLNNNYTTNSSNSKRTSSQSDEKSLKRSPIISTNRKTKVCALCSQSFNQSEYEDHVESCSNNDKTSENESAMMTNSGKANNSKSCPKISRTNNKQTKFCGICSQQIDESEYRNHVQSCSVEEPSNSYSYIDKNKNKKHKQGNSKKECVICFESVDESEYLDHVTSCSLEQDTKKSFNNNNNPKQKSSKKECIICLKSIDESEYLDHVTSCSSENSSPVRIDDYQTNSFDQSTTPKRFSQNEKNPSRASGGRNLKTSQDCIICFKPIELSEYENHVLACVAQTENGSPNPITRNNLKCLSCNRQINTEDGFHHEMACHSRHNHCLGCLRRSMEEFARNREPPVCHKSLCDYELSRHDISSIPLERRLSDRLLKLVKGQQRPLCPKCYFYININENENLDEHIELCDDLIPCEYCQLPFPFKQLEIHARQCRSDQTSKNEKLIHFILIRTKYPFTKEQIRIFIQQQSKNPRNQLDPSSIIEALAIFGPTFPYDIPTRECGICMESRPYDDIYVFDCEESHKLCYACYYQSCQAKMTAAEILTCALCTHPLRDGELNQLRIPKDELKKIRDYQMKKTFDAYSSRTRGIIKCPSQNCTWVAEAADPNERFRVECPQCTRIFCSLCNQQYHYRTTCQQLPQITQRWFFWCENERARYLTMRAQQDATYTAQLENFNRQNNENENRNKDLRRRYDELMGDEQYKTQNCRLCPSCKRVVQRLEGCDSMICGQDAHGGNLQSGCGAKFNWVQAQPYTPTATQQPKQTILDLPKPDNPIVHHEGVKCDQCQNDVHGIRFDCVHCPALTFCEKCEQQSTLIHSRENQAYEQQQHVFQLIMVPEEEAIQF